MFDTILAGIIFGILSLMLMPFMPMVAIGLTLYRSASTPTPYTIAA